MAEFVPEAGEEEAHDDGHDAGGPIVCLSEAAP